MKILFTIHSLSGGGAETQLRMLSRELSCQGNDVVVFYVTGDPKATDRENPIKYYQCASDAYPTKLPFEIYRLIQKERPDVVHAWIPATISISTLLAARYAGTPCVTSIRNRRRVDSALRLVSLVTTALFSKGLISNNSISQSSWSFRSVFRAKNGIEISNAVEQSEKGAPITAKANLGSAPTVIYVGRLTKQKSVCTLLKALCFAANTKTRLQIFGEGEDLPELILFCETNGLTNRVKFNGFSNNISEHYRKADLLVLPSIYEGMPNVVSESLAHGTPALVSRIPAHTSAFTDGEVAFFQPENESDLALQLQKLLENRPIPVPDSAIKFVADRSPTNVANQYSEVYRRVACNG